MMSRLAKLFLAIAVGLIAFVLLDFWSQRNAPLYKRFERQWRDDIAQLEGSGKLPDVWFQVGEVKVTGGTPETRELLERVQSPLKVSDQGPHKLDALVVLWDDEGRKGVLIQYDLVDGATGNLLAEFSRTFLISRSDSVDSWKALVETLTQ